MKEKCKDIKNGWQCFKERLEKVEINITLNTNVALSATNFLRLPDIFKWKLRNCLTSVIRLEPVILVWVVR